MKQLGLLAQRLSAARSSEDFNISKDIHSFMTDAYNSTGGYNLRSGGFVQTSKNIMVEGAILQPSVFGGDQVDLTIKIWKDSKSKSWWLGVIIGNGVLEPVGYCPSGRPLFLPSKPITRRQYNGAGRSLTKMNMGGTPKPKWGRSIFLTVEGGKLPICAI
ncbi:hypothetical protein Bca4012_041117 [Brassica carinata]